jgi:4-amino-4-deoxy-L-arabinose transferase-like glycosyltransferase
MSLFSASRSDPSSVSEAELTPVAPTNWKELAGLCALCLVVLLPFIAKPVHNDDPVFLWAAKQIARHPLDFYGVRVNWEWREQPMSEFFQSPPLLAYYLAGMTKLVGWSEVGLHAALLPFSLLTVAGTYLLASRFCRRPALAVLLMLGCPAFLVSATTLMCDVPLLCFWVWSVLLWLWGSQRSWALLPLAGLSAAAAGLTKYPGINLLPLLIAAGALWPASRRTRLIQALSLLIPVAAWAAYEWFTRVQYGTGLLLGAASHVKVTQNDIQIPPTLRLLDTLAFIGGGAFAVALVALLITPARMRWICLPLAGLLGFAASRCVAAPPAWIGISSIGPAWVFFLQYGLLAAAGVVIVMLCVILAARCVRRIDWRDDVFLILWIGGVAVFCAFFNWAINARTILPLVPAACILATRAFERFALPPQSPRRLSMALASAGALAVAVAVADFRLAAICRDAADQLLAVPIVAEARSQRRLWFAGHSGFQYYMEARGVRAVDAEAPQFKPGDLVIFPLNNYGATPGGHGFRFTGAYRDPSQRWLTTMQSQMGGAFYTSFGQGLPFVFGPVPAESFSVLQVTPDTRLYH